MTPIVVPAVGESISEVQISQWLKKEGEWVAAGTDLVDLETEKASVQVSAPVDGILLRRLQSSSRRPSRPQVPPPHRPLRQDQPHLPNLLWSQRQDLQDLMVM
jgi:hypothetical protein